MVFWGRNSNKNALSHASNSDEQGGGISSSIANNTSPVTLEGLSTNAYVKSNVACVSAQLQVDVRGDVLFELLSDPNRHSEIFKSIEGVKCRLLGEEGPRKRYEVDYQARWKFWRVSGVCQNHVFMETNADEGSVSFRLREPGFLRVYEGTWTVCPVGETALNLYTRKRQQQPQQQQQPEEAVTLALQNRKGRSSFERPHNIAPLGPFTDMQVDMDRINGGSSIGDGTGSPRTPPWSGLFRNVNIVPPQYGAGMMASITTPMMSFKAHIDRLASSASSSGSSTPRTPTSPRQQHASDSQEGVGVSAPIPARSVLRLHELRVGPKIAPPPMLGGLLKGHTISQVEEMMQGLLSVAQSLQAKIDSTAVLVKNSINSGNVSAGDSDNSFRIKLGVQGSPSTSSTTSQSQSFIERQPSSSASQASCSGASLVSSSVRSSGNGMVTPSLCTSGVSASMPGGRTRERSLRSHLIDDNNGDWECSE